jgi:hypothetical protein
MCTALRTPQLEPKAKVWDERCGPIVNPGMVFMAKGRNLGFILR